MGFSALAERIGMPDDPFVRSGSTRRRAVRLAGAASFLFATAATLCLTSVGARAETLREALLRAYSTNPDLTAARARLRAIDENVGIAAAAGRPQAGGTASATQNVDELGRFHDRGRTLTASAIASYPIYAGGRVRNAVRAANARVVASRADLRAVEGEVFTQVVTTYMDVIRDAYVVSLNENQIKVLEANFDASKERYQTGDLTRTDVAQSEARLADARSQLAAAQGALVASREIYRRVVGVWPVDLEMPPELPPLPASADDAADVALEYAPDLEASRAAAQAARYDIATARADRLPVLSTSAGATYTNYLGTSDRVFGVSGVSNAQSSGFAGLTASIPLYQGGGPAARVRQAQALHSEANEQNVGVERQVIATVRAAFTNYRVAETTIRSSEVAVGANELALRGTREENSVGTRLLLDVLNAQQELLNSQVALIAARHDRYVAGFDLLNAMGRGDLESLNLDGAALYDPLPDYRRASRSISDWNDERERPADATRTTGPTPNDAPATRIEPVRIDGDTINESVTVTRPPLGDPASGPILPPTPPASSPPTEPSVAAPATTPQPR